MPSLHDPSFVLANFSEKPATSGQCDWYQLADIRLGVESEDVPLRLRFRQLFGECLCHSPETPDVKQLHCSVQSREDSTFKLVTFTAPERLDIVGFLVSLFQERGYFEMNGDSSEWRLLGVRGNSQPLLSVRGNVVLADGAQAWQPVIANCAVNWAMRLQPELLFFHAAGIGVGEAGLLITGEKGTGKSTLSLALAARGHDFLADEIAAIRKRTYEVVPLRRAVSIRPGPQAAKIEELLQQISYSNEVFPDGTTRVRAEAGDFFPGKAPRAVPLRWAFFLRGFSDQPQVEEFEPRLEDLRLLAPLACTYWGTTPTLQMMQVAKLLSNARCYHLHPGMPDDTAKLIEEIVEAQ